MGTQSVPAEVTALIRDHIKAREKAGATGDDLAAELTVSRTQVINVRDGTRGAGPKMERALAELKYGGSVDALRRAAKGESVVVERDIANEELRRAVEFRRGQLPNEFLDEYLDGEAKSTDRLTRDEYLKDIDAKHARWKGKAMPTRKPGARDDLDAPPPGARGRGKRSR